MAGVLWTCSSPDAVIDPLICGKACFHSVEEESLEAALGAFGFSLAAWVLPLLQLSGPSRWVKPLQQCGTRNTCRPSTAASMIPKPLKPLVRQQTKEALLRDTSPGIRTRSS